MGKLRDAALLCRWVCSGRIGRVAWGILLAGLTAGTCGEALAEYDGLIVTGVRYGDHAQWGLYEIGEDGQGLRQTIRGGSFARYAPDRKQFVFARGGTLWIHLPDGSRQPCSAGELPWPDARHVAWAPDGGSLYASLRLASLEDIETYAGLCHIELTAFTAPTPFFDSAHRLDVPGPSVAFPAVSREGAVAVCVIDEIARIGLVSAQIHLRVEDDTWKRITSWSDRHLELRPIFSPNGEKLAFDVIDRDARTQRTFIYDLLDGSLTQVELPENVPDFMAHTWALEWRSDGRSLVVGWGTLRAPDSLPTRLGLWTDGHVNEVRSVGGIPIRDVSWSPSGRRLAVIADDSRRDPGTSALVGAYVAVFEIDPFGDVTAHHVLYQAHWTEHLDRRLRWDPVVPVAVEW